VPTVTGKKRGKDGTKKKLKHHERLSGGRGCVQKGGETGETSVQIISSTGKRRGRQKTKEKERRNEKSTRTDDYQWSTSEAE